MGPRPEAGRLIFCRIRGRDRRQMAGPNYQRDLADRHIVAIDRAVQRGIRIRPGMIRCVERVLRARYNLAPRNSCALSSWKRALIAQAVTVNRVSHGLVRISSRQSRPS